MNIKDYCTGECTKLNRGYITNALTDGEKKIFGMIKDDYINVWTNESKFYYWSEVYVEPRCIARIIRKGMLLVNPADAELSELHEQSKINLGAK